MEIHPLQATLRAAVFTCVDEHERALGVHVPNPTALGVKHHTHGKQTLPCTVRERTRIIAPPEVIRFTVAYKAQHRQYGLFDR